jgi:hypothetical protein
MISLHLCVIADVYKFIEHVHKIQIAPKARSLFLFYFPRFADYFDTAQSIKFLRTKILKTNFSPVRWRHGQVVDSIHIYESQRAQAENTQYDDESTAKQINL